MPLSRRSYENAAVPVATRGTKLLHFPFTTSWHEILAAVPTYFRRQLEPPRMVFARTSVEAQMFTSGEHLKILKTIVVFLEVAMMDILAVFQRASQMLTHHQPMFANESIAGRIWMFGSRDHDVPVCRDISSTVPFVVPTTAIRVALNKTEGAAGSNLPPQPARHLQQFTATTRACTFGQLDDPGTVHVARDESTTKATPDPSHDLLRDPDVSTAPAAALTLRPLFQSHMVAGEDT